MKKTFIFAAILAGFLSSSSSQALDLDKIAGKIEKATNGDVSVKGAQDKLTGNIEEKINKVTDRIESRIEKYEKKIDQFEEKITRYEQKLDKAEKNIDEIIDSLSAANLKKYLTIAIYVVIGFAVMFAVYTLLLILVFIQLVKVGRALKLKA